MLLFVHDPMVVLHVNLSLHLSSPLSWRQCNHRSWADFMVDQYVTEGRSFFMGR